MKLKSYKHFPVKTARDLCYGTRSNRFKVTTINWTYGTENGVQNYEKVHHNVYETTLEELIEWIRDTEEVAEDIIKIERMEEK